MSAPPSTVDRVRRIGIALLPLALAPVLGYLIASGRLDLGGGEKDLVWVLPWLVWSILFAIGSFVLWRRGWTAVRSTVWSAAIALAGLLCGAALLAAFGKLGVGGRF